MATAHFDRSSCVWVGGLRSDVHLIYVNRRLVGGVLIHSSDYGVMERARTPMRRSDGELGS